MTLSWTHLTFMAGVDLFADEAGITIVTLTERVRLTNEQLLAIGASVRDHLDAVRGGEVDMSSKAFRMRYWGIE